jgi:ZIP family zinc transporter
MLLPVGSAAALALVDVPQPIVAGAFAFALIALLYLVTEELLIEAHEVEDTAWMPAAFFVGFLAVVLCEKLL